MSELNTRLAAVKHREQSAIVSCQRLRVVLAARNMSRIDLAKLTSYSQTSVQLWTSPNPARHRKARFSVVKRISTVTAVSLEFLCDPEPYALSGDDALPAKWRDQIRNNRYYFAQRLRIAMAARGITPADLGSDKTLARYTIDGWLNGRNVPFHSSLSAFSDACDAPLEWLLKPYPVTIK